MDECGRQTPLSKSLLNIAFCSVGTVSTESKALFVFWIFGLGFSFFILQGCIWASGWGKLVLCLLSLLPTSTTD